MGRLLDTRRVTLLSLDSSDTGPDPHRREKLVGREVWRGGEDSAQSSGVRGDLDGGCSSVGSGSEQRDRGRDFVSTGGSVLEP